MAYRKLGRDSSARKALLRSIVTSLFQHERIETTEAKAKELRKIADKMITLAKRGDLHARRQVLAYMMDESVVKNYSMKSLVNMQIVKAAIRGLLNLACVKVMQLRWLLSN